VHETTTLLLVTLPNIHRFKNVTHTVSNKLFSNWLLTTPPPHVKYPFNCKFTKELIPVLCSQPAGAVSHNPGGRLPLLCARLTVTPATLKGAATNFAAW